MFVGLLRSDCDRMGKVLPSFPTQYNAQEELRIPKCI